MMVSNFKTGLILIVLVFLSACEQESQLALGDGPVINQNMKLINEKILALSEFGKTKVSVFKEGQVFYFTMTDLVDAHKIKKRLLEFDDGFRDGLSQIDFYSMDLNADKKDDFLISHMYVIAAGPMAGMEGVRYLAFVNKNDRYIAFEKNAQAQNILDKSEGLNSIEKVKKLYVDLSKGVVPGTVSGEDVPDNKKASLHLLENEKLIFTFKRLNSDKRLTIAIDKAQNYLVYRYGKAGKVELTYMMKKGDNKDKFEYLQHDQYGASRNEIKKLIFTVNDYRYSIYDNYIEGKMDEKDGVGVVIENKKTNKKTRLQGDKLSVSGKLEWLKNIDWIKVSLLVGE